jgi:hypothetical protein
MEIDTNGPGESATALMWRLGAGILQYYGLHCFVGRIIEIQPLPDKHGTTEKFRPGGTAEALHGLL